MNPLLSFLAGTCLLLALSQQLIGAGAQEEVTSTSPVSTVAGESTTTATKDASDSSEEDRPKGGKGHGCLSGFMGGKAPGGMKGDQKKPMVPFPKFADKNGPGMQNPTMKMPMGGHGGPTGGFGGNHPGSGSMSGFGAMRRPIENKPQ